MAIINLPKDSTNQETNQLLRELISQSAIQHEELNRSLDSLLEQLRILNMYFALITDNQIERGDI